MSNRKLQLGLFVVLALLFNVGIATAQKAAKPGLWFNAIPNERTKHNVSLPDHSDNSAISSATAASSSPLTRGQLAASSSQGTVSSGPDAALQFAEQLVTNKINQVVNEQINDNAPDWLKRVDFAFDYESAADPTYSISTVQPLYQSPGNINTVFTQLRYASHRQFDETRNTTNLGIGYRELIQNGTMLVGANIHYDREWKRDHYRLGIGVEARWSGADIYLNRYQGLSGKRTITSSVTEEIIDGWDLRALIQIPYIPSARLNLAGSTWRKTSSDDVSGIRAGIEADLSPHLTFEIGAANDNDDNDVEMFVGIRFNLGGDNANNNILLQKNFVADTPWHLRDMSKHTLDRVRRENNIRLKRTTTSGGSITVEVARG